LGAGGKSEERQCVGEIVNMKLSRIGKLLGVSLASACLVLAGGCGNYNAANVVAVNLSQTAATVIVSQSFNITAVVTGATNLNVTWACTYKTTTVTGTTSHTSAALPCKAETGNIPAGSNQTNVTFTAPSKVPDQTTFPGLVITLTATSVQNPAKTATCTITLDSGIFVAITPTTASVPTGEQQVFFSQLTNDLQTKGVTWLITQTAPTATIALPNVATCSPGCGTLSTPVAGSSSITYTAPTTVPTSTAVTTTPAALTIVATANGDNTRFTTGTITIVKGGPITFNGISPTIAPAGSRLWDIFLDAPNISSASVVTLTSTTTGQTFPLTSAGGQVKILFPIPTVAVPAPTSTGARIRLNEQNLSAADTYKVTLTDPAQTVTTNATPSFQVLPVRPSSTSSSPNDLVQASSSNELQLVIDGGYFGLGGKNANIVFQGNTVPQEANLSSSRQLFALLPSNEAGPPGLYPLSITGSATAPLAPLPSNSSVTTMAIFPNYSVTPPSAVGTPITAGTNLSAIDFDPTTGIAAVADTGGNQIEFFAVGPGTLTPVCSPLTSASGASVNVPTGVSVNRNNHTVAVVNYGDQSVSVFPIPTPGNCGAGTPFNVPLPNNFQGQNPLNSQSNTPYAIGVDPDTNLALVAYSNPSTISLANIGFIVNLNSGATPPFGCLQDAVTGTKNPGPCVFAQVSLNTGSFPQIALAPHGHIAYVTPGGSGPTTAVDLTKPSASVGISSLALTSGIVTVTTSAAHNLNAGNPGTVLITGVKAANGTNFNGVFTVVAVLSSTQFEYQLTSAINDSGTGGTVFYSSPNLVFGISQTAQGIAINPITLTAAIADGNATGSNGPQIDLINSLDQSITSILFNATCTVYVTSCASAPELLGTTGVAWQPYSNALVSYNPALNQVSVSDPVTQQRYAIACQSAAACQTNPVLPTQITLSGAGMANLTVANAPGGSLKLFGGIAVDPDTNQAIVVMSGSSSIELINLGPSTTGSIVNQIKPVQLSEVVVPSPTPGTGVIGGVPNALVPNAALTSTTNLSGVKIFGSGFGAADPSATNVQVRLDGISINGNALCPAGGCVNVINDRELDVTIPTSIPSADPKNPIQVLGFPHKFALDVVSNGVPSNATSFYVIQAVDLSGVCSPGPARPSSVALADQIANGAYSPIAIVSNSGCSSISVIDLNPTAVVAGSTVANPNFGTIQSTVTVGSGPQGVAIDQHRGLAVVANFGDNTVSVIDLTVKPPVQKVPAVTVGTNPAGLAINDATDVAIVANTASTSVSLIDLSLLFPPSGTTAPTTLTAINAGVGQIPTAVAIDPDRGTFNQGIAVVTALQLVNGSAPVGSLDVVDIGLETPALSTSISTGTVSASPTGIVFDPTVITGTTNNGVFYATSSGSNVISSFNPDTSASTTVSVGINPTSLAINPQTGAVLTSNALGNSVSIVDTLSTPIKTRETLSLPGSSLFNVAIDPFTNLAAIVDQANNRLLIFPVPN
jgi:hypothetical protein